MKRRHVAWLVTAIGTALTISGLTTIFGPRALIGSGIVLMVIGLLVVEVE
jgi:hypothetical protein